MDFFKQYFDYVGETEAPALYHRWCAVSLVGAMLGRQVHIPFGHGKIYPNQYIMLMGSPGARKGTAINIGRKLLSKTGYNRFAPDRTSKERFLIDLKPRLDEELDGDLELLVFDAPSELYAVAEEFTDWVGQGGMEFMTMLTKLWDNMDKYEHPKITGKNVIVEKPTVNILGGNTVQGLTLAIPPEALGNGFMSRIIFVHAEATGKKITFPKPVPKALQDLLVTHLQKIKEITGEILYEEDCYPILDRLYKEFQDVDDPRFKHYGSRRFTHLLKLAMIICLMDLRKLISVTDVLKANTLLHYTELRMPKALGEFGKSKYSDVANNIMDQLNKAPDTPRTMNEVWKTVAKDLNKISELGDIMKNLMTSGKVQVVTIKGKQGYVPLHTHVERWSPDLLLDSFLTDEELM